MQSEFLSHSEKIAALVEAIAQLNRSLEIAHVGLALCEAGRRNYIHDLIHDLVPDLSQRTYQKLLDGPCRALLVDQAHNVFRQAGEMYPNILHRTLCFLYVTNTCKKYVEFEYSHIDLVRGTMIAVFDDKYNTLSISDPELNEVDAEILSRQQRINGLLKELTEAETQRAMLSAPESR